MSYNQTDKEPACNHEPDPMSAAQADDSPFIVDYTCIHCGVSGAAAVEPSDIQFDEPTEEELTYTRV